MKKAIVLFFALAILLVSISIPIRTFTTMYSLDARTTLVDITRVDSYKNSGWYSEPVAKLYSKDGKTSVVPLSDVFVHRKKGWFPLHAFIINSTQKEISSQFPMEFKQYYPGTPESGDIPRNIYITKPQSPVEIVSAEFSTISKKCVAAKVKLKDLFPYLLEYADTDGRISKDAFKDAFENSYYGANYINPEQIPALFDSTFRFEETFETPYDYYIFSHDYMQFIVDKDSDGYINFNTAYCSFNTLT